MMNIEIANRLVQLRKDHNLSQEALAAKLGISRQAVSKWERAEASPDTDNLMALAELYGMTLDDLLNAVNDKYQISTAEDVNEQKTKEPKTARQLLGIKMVKFPAPILIVALYLILGFCFDGWHPGWLVLMLIPIYYCTGAAFCIRRKKAMLLTLPYPIVVVTIYLLLGFTLSWWHPAWIVFLTVPLYYWLISVFYKEKPQQSDNGSAQK